MCKWLFVIGFMVIAASCATPVLLPSYRAEAEAAAGAGHYKESIEAWKNFFQQHPGVNDLEGTVYAQAAKNAFKAGEMNQAVEWFDQARYRDYADYEMYKILSDIFRQQDNLSKELSALEYIKEHFDSEDDETDSRLFAIYNDIDMVDKAMKAWGDMPQDRKSDLGNLEKFFAMNRQLGNDAVCDSVSRVLLTMDGDNLMALDWNAQKIYHRAEERFQREMLAYERNRTRRQYRVLLEELEVATADYKQALVYFEKLWELQPAKRLQYATFMSNIYVRFKDEKRALYYRNYREP